jgi:aspartate aminotransferase-like enzyme
MARPVIHHRTPDFSKALDSAQRLQPLFGTKGKSSCSSTGTGAMERRSSI